MKQHNIHVYLQQCAASRIFQIQYFCSSYIITMALIIKHLDLTHIILTYQASLE